MGGGVLIKTKSNMKTTANTFCVCMCVLPSIIWMLLYPYLERLSDPRQTMFSVFSVRVKYDLFYRGPFPVRQGNGHGAFCFLKSCFNSGLVRFGGPWVSAL